LKTLLASLVVVSLAGGADAATVTVSVSGVHNDHGHVLVALCTRADFLRPHCSWKARVAAQKGTVIAKIPGVPPGVYAAQAFHDENDNGRLERTLLGLPREAMGFSNDAPMRLGPPRFDAAAFNVSGDAVAIGFSLRYFR